MQTFRAILAAAVLALPLGGCVDTGSDLNATRASLPQATSIARRADVSPGGTSVGFASLEGPPQALQARFVAAFASEAGSREIQLVDPKAARYQMRAYLTAYATEGGTAIAYVWDVFDSDKRRAQRLTDALVVKGTAADPWSVIDDKALASVAAKSADDLAAFLSNTPEAIAAAKTVRPALAAAGKPAAKPLSFAPAE